MKTRTLLIAAVLTTCTSGHLIAQVSMADILLKRTTLTWVGLDFSEARFTPRAEFGALDQRGGNFFHSMNALIDREAAKYDLAGPMGLDYVQNNSAYVVDVNSTFEPARQYVPRTPALGPDDVPSMVAKYATTGQTGAGVVFVVSKFDKAADRAEYLVAFFDMATHDVLHVERIQGKPFGAGLRNYWAGSVSSVLKEIKGNYARAWKQRFAKG